MNPYPVDILLVEDNPDHAELILRALRKRNPAARAKVVKDGVEALEFVFGEGAYEGRDVAHHPRVVLLDLKLPRISGLEVLSRIKTDDRTRAIPVVAFTSSQDERDVLESYRLGVNSYVLKPVEFNEFSQAIADLGAYWVALNKAPA